MVACRQTWCWGISQVFYKLTCWRQEGVSLTGCGFKHMRVKAHFYSDTLAPSRPHLLIVPLLLGAIFFQITTDAILILTDIRFKMSLKLKIKIQETVFSCGIHSLRDTYWPDDWLTDWLIDWLIDWTNDWFFLLALPNKNSVFCSLTCYWWSFNRGPKRYLGTGQNQFTSFPHGFQTTWRWNKDRISDKNNFRKEKFIWLTVCGYSPSW